MHGTNRTKVKLHLAEKRMASRCFATRFNFVNVTVKESQL